MPINLSKSMLIKNLTEKIHLSSNSEEESFQEDLNLVKMKDQNNKAKTNNKERNPKRKIANKTDEICLYSLN